MIQDHSNNVFCEIVISKRIQYQYNYFVKRYYRIMMDYICTEFHLGLFISDMKIVFLDTTTIWAYMVSWFSACEGSKDIFTVEYK